MSNVTYRIGFKVNFPFSICQILPKIFSRVDKGHLGLLALEKHRAAHAWEKYWYFY